MEISLTSGQEKGLKIACNRFKNKESYTCIAGYAGTGKSTLVQYIIEALNLNQEDVAYCAYTGKAALVLQNKKCPNACTSHRLLYNSNQKQDGTFIHRPKNFLDKNYKLIIVDEISMLPNEIWKLLLTHRVPVITLGDPFQLPPITEDNGVLQNPHVFLTDVMRQAQDNPIIKMSMDIRSDMYIDYGGTKEARVIHKEDVTKGLLMGADIVLCGKNTTRHDLNDKMRHYKWGNDYKDFPIDGDKSICLKNQWDSISDTGFPLINGTIGTLRNINIHNTQWFKPDIKSSFESECNGFFSPMSMDYKIFTAGEPTINKTNWKKYPKDVRPFEFDYGYAVTVHKYQGSQADKVLVYDEWLGDREYHRRWLYTAATRASKQLVIVR